MSIADRLKAMGAGAAQGATGDWADEGYAKILDWLPRPDEEIPREYAGGSAYNQYRDEARADNAELQRKYPLNYGAGQILGGAPAALATGGAGAAGSVGLGAGLGALSGAGLGALSGAGASENTGMELAKDAARGGAVGGGLAAGFQGVKAAVPAARGAMQRLMSRAPAQQMQPAMAGPQVNMSYDPREAYYDKFTKGFERLKNKGSITPEAYGKLADTSKKLAATPRGQPVEAAAMDALERKSIAPSSLEEEERVFRNALENRIPVQEEDAMLQNALGGKGLKPPTKIVNRRFTGEETGEDFLAPYGEKGAARVLKEKDPLEAAMSAQEAKKTIRPGKIRK